MAYRLRPDLHFCDTGSHIVLLDVSAGRYFSVPPGWASSFRDCLTRGDGADPSDPALAKLLSSGVIVEAHDAGVTPGSPSIAPPARALLLDRRSRAQPSLILQVIWAQFRVASSLRQRGFHAVVRDLQDRKSRALPPEPLADQRKVTALISAFGRADFVMTKADACLVRSITLCQLLLRSHQQATLVIGVTVSPFSAHAWVQACVSACNWGPPDSVIGF